jgi:hypothetical protein
LREQVVDGRAQLSRAGAVQGRRHVALDGTRYDRLA